MVHRNIRELLAVRRRFEANRGPQEYVIDRISAFAGSPWALYFHAALYGGWLLLNSGVIPLVEPWDPFPFVMLAMFASVEAIFLSTFVLITQNRMARISEQRAELDLQINLLAEHEVAHLIEIADAIARKLNVSHPSQHATPELTQDVSPQRVLEEIERVNEQDRD